ncbi:hypothetical protein [uncultured Pseudomonas sp.]|jgi:uncharacterized protein HemX|uniref:hypothetical protein n=1 Tax=uncultured Pseudomonas sp. TaxID=114707 RepID=UPI00258653C4|nr:hypothetical protein [uncultured Pseudomonas sp.]
MPNNLPPLPGPGAGLSDWIAWALLVVIAGAGYLFLHWREKKGPESERLNSVLAEERASHRETKAELLETQRLLEESRQNNNALVREFAENKAQIARMEVQMQYLTEEIAELKAELLKRNTA